MLSRYGIFCGVIEHKSFTRTAEKLGYSQSAVSQAVRALELETETVVIDRRKDGIALTPDGEQYLPYFQQIHQAEQNLERKEQEMKGLKNSVVQKRSPPVNGKYLLVGASLCGSVRSPA